MTDTRPLRQIRRERLLTIDKLADRAGVSHMTVKSAESGRRTPMPSTIRRLSEALDVEPLEIAEFAAAIREEGR